MFRAAGDQGSLPRLLEDHLRARMLSMWRLKKVHVVDRVEWDANSWFGA